MNLRSVTLGFVSLFLIVGCATEEPPPTPAQTQPEKKDRRGHEHGLISKWPEAHRLMLSGLLRPLAERYKMLGGKL